MHINIWENLGKYLLNNDRWNLKIENWSVCAVLCNYNKISNIDILYILYINKVRTKFSLRVLRRVLRQSIMLCQWFVGESLPKDRPDLSAPPFDVLGACMFLILIFFYNTKTSRHIHLKAHLKRQSINLESVRYQHFLKTIYISKCCPVPTTIQNLACYSGRNSKRKKNIWSFRSISYQTNTWKPFRPNTKMLHKTSDGEQKWTILMYVTN